MKESALRDLIAQHIKKLKPGLTLLQKEQYIPNEHGTKSSILAQRILKYMSLSYPLIGPSCSFPFHVFTPIPAFPSRASR